MSRRGSGNPEKNVEKWIKEEMASKVELLMDNRHMLMVPFPVPAADVYATLWTPAQMDACEVLKGTSLLKMYREFTLIGCPGPDDKGIRRVAVVLEEDHPLPRALEAPFDELPDAMQKLIKAWIPTWLQYRSETASVVEKVKQIGRVCSTYGQVVRIWPELQGFLGEWGAEKVHRSKAKSPYPEGVLYWTDDPNDPDKMIENGLRPEFAPSVYEPLSHMIAECLMLPEIDNLYHVGRVGT